MYCSKHRAHIISFCFSKCAFRSHWRYRTTSVSLPVNIRRFKIRKNKASKKKSKARKTTLFLKVLFNLNCKKRIISAVQSIFIVSLPKNFRKKPKAIFLLTLTVTIEC